MVKACEFDPRLQSLAALGYFMVTRRLFVRDIRAKYLVLLSASLKTPRALALLLDLDCATISVAWTTALIMVQGGFFFYPRMMMSPCPTPLGSQYSLMECFAIVTESQSPPMTELASFPSSPLSSSYSSSLQLDYSLPTNLS